MGWAEFMLPAAALAATVMTGGAAAPAAAGALGAEAGAAGAAAAGTAAAESAAAAGAAGAAEAGAAGAGAGLGTAGTAESLQAASAAGAANAPALGSGMSGAANPFGELGSMAGGGNTGLPLGMTQGPMGTTPQLGSGLSGTGAFAEMPGQAGAFSTPVSQGGAGLTAEQMAKLGNMMNRGEGQQQQRAPYYSGQTAPAKNTSPTLQALTAQSPSARPSLGQILYGKG